MDIDFLRLLPESVQMKVNAIEREIGREMDVRRGSTESYKGNNPTPPLAFCRCDDSCSPMLVEIVLSPEAATHNFIHEVLHVYRVVVLRVPRLICPDRPGLSLIEALENDAEHLFIVPEEIALDGAAASFWEKEDSRHFDRLTERLLACESDESELPAVRHGLLRLWLFISRVLPDWPRRDELYGVLQCQGWQSAADALVDEINISNVEKVDVLKSLLRSGRLPLEPFRLLSWGSPRTQAI